MGYSIRKIGIHNIEKLLPLGRKASKEGYNFVNRTIREFLSGENDFTGKGEIIYGIFENDNCIGFCGLNIDPYIDEKEIGRLRHLYVDPGNRMMGVGELLVGKLLEDAMANFKILRLKSTTSAMLFYDKMGFDRSEGENESHRLILRKGK